MERQQRTFDWWMWTTLIIALLCFSVGALTFNAIGSRGIAGLSIFLGFASLLSFFLRMYYRRRQLGQNIIGKLISVENGTKRNVEVMITAGEIRSEISSPAGAFSSGRIDHYEVSGLQQHDTGLVTLILVLTDGQRVRFYSTESKFDMVLLLDQLDATIGERKREASSDA